MLMTLRSSIKRRVFLRLGRSTQCESGAISIEFALIVPVLLAIFFGITELTYYDMNNRRAKFSAEYAADYLSRDDDFVIRQKEIWMAEDIWQIVNYLSFKNSGGDAYVNSRGKYTRSFSSIQFVKDPPNCTIGDPDCELLPKMEWSFLATQGISDPKRRSCDQNIIPAGQVMDETTLSEAYVGRSSLAVVDFTWKYTPLFGGGLFPEGREKHLTAVRAMRGAQPLSNPGYNSPPHWVNCPT